ncbi:BatD family protein [Aliivibrio logei]|uniref:BatD family protein n=1 Tax=Aliivibrio logei TaxID=688 RepID=UPI00039C3D44|nr:BatD family protein [Aliivibrio logei]
MSQNNDKRRAIHLCLLVVIVLTVLSFSARSHAAEKLAESDQITITTWLTDTDNGKENSDKTPPTYAVNQQVILYIEVVTPRWFTGGTRIAPIEIPNVVAKQRNQLATNFTERRNGTTWTHQRWEVTLYPQSEGNFVVPPTAVKVQVSRDGGGNASGVLYTEPQQFSAITPSGLLSDESKWVSGRDFSIEQEWDKSNDELKAGDAITRTLTIKGSDTLAMLIPELISATSTVNYQTYAQPNQLSDSQTRGDYLSERKESVVYVLQNGGELTFPPINLTWWDTDAQELKTITLDGKSFAVTHTLSSWLHQYWQLLSVLVSLGLVVLFIAVKTIRYYQTHPLPAWFVYSKAVKKQEWGTVRVFLYRALRSRNNQLELKQYRTTKDWWQETSDFQTDAITKTLSRRLWKQISQPINGLSSLWGKWKPKEVFPQLSQQREKYEKNQEYQHKSDD